MAINFTPRKFQEDGVRRIYGMAGRVLLADDQGTGKTISALMWISRINAHRPVVIVTPSSVKYHWQMEARQKFGLQSRVLEGRGPKQNSVWTHQDKILIINYDILWFWLRALMKCPPKVVVFDECQYISNPQARRTKASKHLAKHAQSVLGLSGTPMTNKPVQLWAVLNIIRPDLFPDFHQFAWRYCKPRHTFWGWRYDGAENKDELHSILVKHVMIRRLKEDVAPELPKKIHKMIPVHLGPAAFKEYDKAKNSFLMWLREKSPARAARAKRAESMVKIGYLLRLCAHLRMPQTINFVKEFHVAQPGEKLVGMTGHTFVIDKLREAFPRTSVVVDGRVTGKLRTEAVRSFTNIAKILNLWGNWRAAGVGLNLQRASNMVSLDPPWTPGDLLQGQDRVHRIGQTKSVMIWYLYAMNTVEYEWMMILRERTLDLKAVLDGKKSIQDVQYDLFGKLIDKIAKKEGI
jgi:SWI/SNF-related matrix-associated actin-dependent regulator 1 of chromatin subfamily A